MTPAEVLLKAADLIDERGWTQGNWARVDGCLCALGGIYHALGGRLILTGIGVGIPDLRLVEDELDLTAAVLAASLPTAYTDPRSAVSYWNDAEDRTKDEVTAALRAAAASVTA